MTTTTPDPRPLTREEIAKASGGAIYLKFDGVDGEVSRSTSGTPAAPGQFPFQVSLRAG